MNEISLALGGGGVRGAAHIGVIRRLEQEGYQIKAIAGTSAGGIVGAAYSAGYTTYELEHFLNKINKSKLFGHKRDDGPSILGLQGFTQHLSELLGDRTFNDLKIPFACVAVDINTYQEIIINTGKVIDAVKATIAVPGIFPPQYIGDSILVDGGVFDPVPVALARWLAPTLPVLAICLSPSPEKWSGLPELRLPQETPIPAPILQQFFRLPLGQAFKIFAESLDASSRMLAELHMKIDKPDLIIRPDVTEIGLLDHIDPLDMIHRGEMAIEQLLPEIKQQLSWLGQFSRQFRKAELPGTVISAPKPKQK
jgi:NTE family protein